MRLCPASQFFGRARERAAQLLARSRRRDSAVIKRHVSANAKGASRKGRRCPTALQQPPKKKKRGTEEEKVEESVDFANNKHRGAGRPENKRLAMTRDVGLRRTCPDLICEWLVARNEKSESTYY